MGAYAFGRGCVPESRAALRRCEDGGGPMPDTRYDLTRLTLAILFIALLIGI